MFVDKERLSYWYALAIIAWTGYTLIGILIFHCFLDISLTKVISFFVVSCAMQCAVTPLIYSARSQPENPDGKPVQRVIAAGMWFTLEAALLVGYSTYGKQIDAVGAETAATVITATFALYSVLYLAITRIIRGLAKRYKRR